MVQITFKSKHFYYVAYYLRDRSIQQYYPVINRIAVALAGNNDMTADFTISATVNEIIDIFAILTKLPEGQANKINVEMDDLFLPQIVLGIADEQANGIGPDADGNLPSDAYWQRIAQGITAIKVSNTAIRDSAINNGKLFVDSL
jgi:hypothetical protein